MLVMSVWVQRGNVCLEGGGWKVGDGRRGVLSAERTKGGVREGGGGEEIVTEQGTDGCG